MHCLPMAVRSAGWPRRLPTARRPRLGLVQRAELAARASRVSTEAALPASTEAAVGASELLGPRPHKHQGYPIAANTRQPDDDEYPEYLPCIPYISKIYSK